MGCDIHDFAEIRDKKTGKWHKVGDVFPNPYFDEEEPADVSHCFAPPDTIVDNYHKDMGQQCNERCYTPNPRLTDHPYQMRNYDLFAMLADVRNGTGFAGSKTGDGFQVIHKPRGIPHNASREVKKISENWGIDGHSHSWLSLKELLEYDWNQGTVKVSWVDAENYLLWQKHGHPDSWCGGGTFIQLSNKMMEEEIKRRGVENQGNCYTQVEWKDSYHNRAGTFVTETIPNLIKLLVSGSKWEIADSFLKAIIDSDHAALNALQDWLEENGLQKLDDLRYVFFFDN